MRAIPIDSSLSHRLGGGQRHVLAEPGGDLTSTEIAPLEVLVQTYNSKPLKLQCVSVWTLSDEERIAVAAGANIRLTVLGSQPPVALGVVPLTSEQISALMDAAE